MKIFATVALLSLALCAGAQHPNFPGPVSHAFITPGLSFTGAAFDVSQSFPMLAGPSGGTTFVQSGGKFYFEFNGTNQMLFGSTNNFAAETTNGTIMARVYLTRNTSTAFRVFASGDNAGVNIFGVLQISSGQPLWDIRGTSIDESFYAGTGTAMVSGRWYTVGFDTDGWNGQLSVDGEDIPQSTNNAALSSAGRWFSHAAGADHIAIGNLKRSTDVYSPGRVSSFFIWNRRLSQEEKRAVHSILSVQGNAFP